MHGIAVSLIAELNRHGDEGIILKATSYRLVESQFDQSKRRKSRIVKELYMHNVGAGPENLG